MILDDDIGHLVSTESVGELHRFAQLIGLKRKWYQTPGIGERHAHYDLTTARAKKRAITNGARLVTSQYLVSHAWWKMGVRLYCGVGAKKWGQVEPPEPGPYACISPVGGREEGQSTTRVAIPKDVKVLQDSGAFSDDRTRRVTFQEAYDRQMEHAVECNYAGQVTYRASYDYRIGEAWTDGNYTRRTWSVEECNKAMDETIRAAEFAADHRDKVAGKVMSVQGVDLEQYFQCAREVIPTMDVTKDKLGFGGYCSIGRRKSQMVIFRDICRVVVPYCADHGVEWIHLWGVIHTQALGELLWICDRYKIQLSTDSAAIVWGLAFGAGTLIAHRDENRLRGKGVPSAESREQNLKPWFDYTKEQVASGEALVHNVRRIRDYFGKLQETPYYCCPSVQLTTLHKYPEWVAEVQQEKIKVGTIKATKTLPQLF